MLIVAEVEFILGLWLVSGLRARACRRAALLAFAALFCVAVYLGVVGRATRGCLGRVEMPPWIMAAVDLAILAALWRISPSDAAPAGASDGAHPLAAWLRFAIPCVLAAAAVVGGTAYIGFGSFSEMARVLSGREITAAPSSVDVGAAWEPEKRDVVFQLTNHSRSSIRVVGGTSNRWCDSTRDLPVFVASGGCGEIKVAVTFRKPFGPFRRRVTFYTDSREQPTVNVDVRGAVLKRE